MSGLKRTVVLFVHGPREVGGDTIAALRMIQHLDQGAVDAVAAVSPACEAWSRFDALARDGLVRLHPVEMGVSDTEASMPGRPPEPHRLEAALAVAQLLRIMVREHVDVVYTLDRSRGVLLATVAARLLNRKLVFHAHYAYYPSTHRGGRLIVRAADRVVAVSDFIKHKYEEQAIPAEQIQTIYNGIEIEPYERPVDRALIRSALGIGPEDPLVLLPGRLSRYKGQMELVEASPGILQRVPTTSFIFAGFDSPEVGDLRRPERTTMLPILQARAAELGVAEHARFLGQTDDMPSLYAAADVVAVPSWEEPFGFVAVEAMAAGRPVVASAAGGTPEVVLADETGILVPPRQPDALAAAITTVLQNPALAERLGRAGYERARARFTVERYCREFEAVFASPG